MQKIKNIINNMSVLTTFNSNKQKGFGKWKLLANAILKFEYFNIINYIYKNFQFFIAETRKIDIY